MTQPDKNAPSEAEKLREAKKLLGRLLGGGGLIFLLAALYFTLSGEIAVGGSQTSMEIRKIVTQEDNPGEFWGIIAFTGLIGLGLVIAGLKIRRS